MDKPIEIYFYYMNGCQWCNDFMPTWKEMKKNRGVTSIISLEEKERGEMTKDEQTINGVPVDGFPTIKIVINLSGKKIEYKYGKSEDSECTGDRSRDDILLCIKEQLEEELTNRKMHGGKQKMRYATRLGKNELYLGQI